MAVDDITDDIAEAVVQKVRYSAKTVAETFAMYYQGESLPDYITTMLEGVLKNGIL